MLVETKKKQWCGRLWVHQCVRREFASCSAAATYSPVSLVEAYGVLPAVQICRCCTYTVLIPGENPNGNNNNTLFSVVTPDNMRLLFRSSHTSPLKSGSSGVVAPWVSAMWLLLSELWTSALALTVLLLLLRC